MKNTCLKRILILILLFISTSEIYSKAYHSVGIGLVTPMPKDSMSWRPGLDLSWTILGKTNNFLYIGADISYLLWTSKYHSYRGVQQCGTAIAVLRGFYTIKEQQSMFIEAGNGIIGRFVIINKDKKPVRANNLFTGAIGYQHGSVIFKMKYAMTTLEKPFSTRWLEGTFFIEL